jgi:hypothetical protein
LSQDGHVTAAQVRRALRQELREELPAIVVRAKADKQQRFRWRQSVRTGFAELLTLLLGPAERSALIAKVQEVQRLLDPVLNPKKKGR